MKAGTDRGGGFGLSIMWISPDPILTLLRDVYN